MRKKRSPQLGNTAPLAACALAVLAAAATLLWMLGLAGETTTEMRGTRIPVSAPVAAPVQAPPRVRPVVNATPLPGRPPQQSESVTTPVESGPTNTAPRPAEAGDLDV